MSTTPDSLAAVRQFVSDAAGVPRANISIRAARSSRGFHAGRSDIYGAFGQGDKDYSVKAPRNKAGLTNASSAVDVKVPYKGAGSMLRQLTASLVAQAASGQDGGMIFEVIGPDPATGKANYWGVLSNWQARPAWADASHEWHVHVSFYRDTEYADRAAVYRRFFEGYTGPKAKARTKRRATATAKPTTG